MNMKFRASLLVAAVLAVGASLSTASIIAYQDGENHPHNGWGIATVQDGSADGPGTLTVPYVGGVGGHPNVGQITETTDTGPDTDIIFNNLVNNGSNNGLVGNYLNLGGGGQTVRSMTAEFYAYQSVGTDVSDFRLYMLAGTPGNLHSWYYDAGPLNPGWGVIISSDIWSRSGALEAM